ncbi:MAG: hypothetical protein GY853_07555 [PVC group bacterium]|nr:hypothetical protein [PVC group bacterium]
MKPPKQPTEHDFWFVSKIRQNNDISRLNKRQQRILEKVRLWEKFNGPQDQKKWNF